MTVFITGSELASFLDKPESEALNKIAEFTNGLVAEEWHLADTPPEPVPTMVRIIAHNVAVRAGRNPKGLSSETRSWDDITRTERWEVAAAMGVFLEADELAYLNGPPDQPVKKVRSIRMVVPDWSCSGPRY